MMYQSIRPTAMKRIWHTESRASIRAAHQLDWGRLHMRHEHLMIKLQLLSWWNICRWSGSVTSSSCVPLLRIALVPSADA